MTVILIDMNSVGHANNAATRLTAGDLETQAIFGTLNSVRDLMMKYEGFTPIGLWDGRAQWRYDLYPEYKAKRKLDPNKVAKPYELKQQQARESYHEQRPYIIKGLQLLGVRQICPQDDEADDLAGYLSKDFSAKGKRVVLVSRDHDWLQLVDKSVSWFNPVDNETVTDKTFEEYTGYKHAMQFVAEKCLVGDSSDNITGVSGIGVKCAPLILHHYGYPGYMIDEIRAAGDDWSPPIKELNRYKKKLMELAADGSEGEAIFHRNVKLMNLLDVKKPSNLEMIHQDLDEYGFEEFCHSLAFHSILRKQEEWLAAFRR